MQNYIRISIDMTFSNKNNEYQVTCPRLCPTIVTPVKGSTVK